MTIQESKRTINNPFDQIFFLLNIFVVFFRNNVPMDVQRRTFKSQLAIAFETNKPIVIHCRDMEVEVFEIMQEVTIQLLLNLKEYDK